MIYWENVCIESGSSCIINATLCTSMSSFIHWLNQNSQFNTHKMIKKKFAMILLTGYNILLSSPSTRPCLKPTNYHKIHPMCCSSHDRIKNLFSPWKLCIIHKICSHWKFLAPQQRDIFFLLFFPLPFPEKICLS